MEAPWLTGELLEALTKVGGVQVGTIFTAVVTVTKQVPLDRIIKLYVPKCVFFLSEKL